MREFSPWGAGPRFLICDNDAIFGKAFEEAAAGGGTEIIHTPLYTPQANGHCERLIKSLKSECLDHMLIFHEQQLQREIKEYTEYYNAERPHQGIEQRVPTHFHKGTVVAKREDGETLLVTPFLNGLHHSYAWSSPPN
jgi:transposase InsO family protein